MFTTAYRVAVLGIIMASAPMAWAAPTDGEKFKDWTVSCETIPPEESAELDVKVEGSDQAAEGDKAARESAATPPAEGVTICQITQTLNEKESNNPIMQVAVGYLPEQENPVAAITLPLGIWLPPGLQLQVDEGKKGRVPLDTCVPGGCRAGIELDAEFLASMKKGNELKVTFGGGNRKPLTIPVSLQGFSAALDALKQ